MSDAATKTWPDLAEGLYERLTGRSATISYEFDDLAVEVPDRTGGDAPAGDLAAQRDAQRPYVRVGALNVRRIVVGGDLTIAGPGVSARLSTPADGSPSLVVEGRARGGLRAGRAAIRRAAGAGLALRVTDARGRELMRIGPHQRSVLGRLLLGNEHARPSLRGLIAFRRGAAGPQVVSPIDHGGTQT